MWQSLCKLKALPEDTVVYCAHEYTESNARFALTVEPHNSDLKERVREIERLRSKGLPTVPTTIGLERKTNPFLRPESTDLQHTLNLEGADAVTVFAETRRRKDSF
jgi:hydroxyacylglutathione hydrolase